MASICFCLFDFFGFQRLAYGKKEEKQKVKTTESNKNGYFGFSVF